MTPPEEESRLGASELRALARQLACDPAFVTRLYEASEQFREICADYATCKETLTRLLLLHQVDDSQVQDYREMDGQLENELRARLGRAVRKHGGEESR